MSFSKSQGKKQDSAQNGGNGGHQQKQQNRNNNSNKKWANNNNNNNATNTTAGSPRNNNNSNHASTAATATTGIEQDAATTKQLHDRMLFLLGNLTGTLVEATVKDGCKFKGIFHGASTEGDLGIALKLAQKIYDPNAPIDKDKTNPNPVKNTMLIFSNDLVEMNAVNVDFTSSSGTETNDRNTFKTDTDISGRLDIKERELHRWAPTEEDNHGGALEGGLDDSDAHGGSWDQFAANEKLFGLKTDFNEEIYTTPLNRSAPGYKDREKRAIKMANEIQKTATTNVHMLEERGLAIDDSGMDEEDLYGAVVRDNSPNKYVPPALRKLQQQQQQQKKEKPVAAGNPLNKLITSDLPKTASNPSPIANLPTTRRDSSEKNHSNEPPKRIEAEIATTFRHFAMMEKDKLHAKKQALQKKEKDGRLAELKAFHQSFKLNVPIPADLVPLLSKKKAPISSEQASNDASNKNGSPVKKTSTPPPPQQAKTTTTTTTTTTNTPTATTAKKASSPAPEKASTTTTATSQAPSSPAPAATTTATTTTASSPAASSSFKFNVKASSFKPNPSAAAFVPGGGANSATSSNRSPAPVPMGVPMPHHHHHHHHTATPEDNSHPHTFFGGGLGGRQIKKGNGPIEHLTMTEAFVPSFLDKNTPASAVGPTWPFGHKSYRVQFSQFGYDEDVYSYPSPNYGYYPTQYRYPFPHHQMPYPQFVQPPPMPPGAYSPQMANVSPHGSPFPPPPPSVAVPAPPQPQPQGYPSPQQRSPMVPQQMPPPPQLYQYGGGAPMMMRYPPEMMMQRPVMVETVPYSSPHHPQQQQQQDTPAATDSGTDTPPLPSSSSH